MFVPDERVLSQMRVHLESPEFFDRYGNAYLVERYKHFGFASVVPEPCGGKVCWFRRMFWSSYAYFPRGWRNDPLARKIFAWAEFLGKNLIFEEDWR